MKTSEEDKEMLGGCCVCSDENGWPDNPLVYCDGEDCNVAVHQACYGIVSVPTGQWFCCRCEAKESPLRARCELCPSKDGALKRTDSGGWAHVVCALYIPEVRFGNVTTMEPIVLQLIPQDRFNKLCYICEEAGRTTRAGVGACMQCNKGGCKHYFHVTCAQERGYLCEEAGNYLDNVKYCGYCGYHFEKLKEDGKKGTNVKTIPPYRPPQHPNNKPHPDGDRIPAPPHSNAGLSLSHSSHGNARTSSSSSSSSNRSRMRNEASSSSSSSSKSSSSAGSSGSSNSSSNRRRSVPRPVLHASTRVTVATASSLASSSSIASTAAISTASSTSISTSSSSVLDKMRQPSVVISSRVPLTAGSTAISSSTVVTSTTSAHSSSSSFSSSKSSHIPVSASKDASLSAPTASHSHASSVQSLQTGSKSTSAPATVAATVSSALPALPASSVSMSTSATTATSSGSAASKCEPASNKAGGHSFVLKRSNFPSTTTMPSTTPVTPVITPGVVSMITSSSSMTMTSVSSASSSSSSSSAAKEVPLAVSIVTSEMQTATVLGASTTTATTSTALQKAPLNFAPATTENETAITAVPTSTTTTTTTTTATTCTNSSTTTNTSMTSSKIGPSSLRRTAGGRSSSSSDDAASSSSSDNLVLNICQEKNLSAVADPSAADVKPSGATKLKLQSVKESLDGPAAGSSMPAKKEEKMEVDDDGQEFKLKVSYTANMSSVPAPKSDPFTPTPADFAVVTAHVDLMPATSKRGRSSSSDRGSRRAKRGSRDGSGGSKRGRWSGGGRAPHAADMDQSPPSSPDSDHLITPKRGRKRAAAVAAALELKESPPSTPTLPTPPSGGLGALTTNGPAAATSQGPAVSANTLLLGNQINPASAVAQEMTDTLHAELQAHSIYKQEEEERVTTPLVGPALPGKKQGASIGVSNSTLNCSSNGNNSSGGSSSNGATQPPPFPQSLEQLLERQWEQGSQFLMEQAQHFDIASLLSCLHQLRQENSRLEESVTALSARRDHLLAVNARLSVPLGPPSSHVSSASPPAGDVGPSGPSGSVGQHTPQHPISSASLNSSPVGGGALPSRSSPVTGASHHQHHLLHNSTTPPTAAPPPQPSGPAVSSHHMQQHHPLPQHHLTSVGVAVSSHGGVMPSGHIPPSHHTQPGVGPQHPQIAVRQQQQQPQPQPPLPPTRHPSGGPVSAAALHRVVSPHDRRPVTHSPQENGLEGAGEYPGKSAGYPRPTAAGGGVVAAQPHSPSMMPPHQPPPPQHHRHSPAGGIYHSSLSPSSSQAPPHALMHPGPPPPPNSSPSMGVGGSSRLVHTSVGAPPPPPPGAGVYQMVSPPASHHAPMPHHSPQVVRRSVADTVEKR